MSVTVNPNGGNTMTQSFVRICNRNYPGGAAYGNPYTLDIMKLYLPTLEACIDACAMYNIVFQQNKPQRPGGADDVADWGLCRSVAIVKSSGGYCYLKNATGKDDTFGAPENFSSGVLLL